MRQTGREVVAGNKQAWPFKKGFAEFKLGAKNPDKSMLKKKKNNKGIRL